MRFAAGQALDSKLNAPHDICHVFRFDARPTALVPEPQRQVIPAMDRSPILSFCFHHLVRQACALSQVHENDATKKRNANHSGLVFCSDYPAA